VNEAHHTGREETMSQVPLWFERKFDFSFPSQLYPNVAARLRGTPARLEDLLRSCPHELLVRKPLAKNEEKWTPQEHAGHLLDLEPLWTARVDDFVSGHSELTAADLTNRGTTEANHNAYLLDQILNAFRKARLSLLDRASQFDPAQSDRTLLHPRMKKPMRLVDHLYFVAEHDDHHLAHIWELVSASK
jgi:uncharacterized damage-inducible protein DinB